MLLSAPPDAATWTGTCTSHHPIQSATREHARVTPDRRDPKLGGNDFGYGSPDSGFRSMTANLQCTDTHFFPKHPSPGFASRAPKIMPVEGNSYPNLQKGLHAKPNVLYGNWQIPEILPRDPARPDIEHFLQLEVPCSARHHEQSPAVSQSYLSGAQEPSSVCIQRHTAAPRCTPARCMGHQEHSTA
jgi:hypothetical protein